MASGKGPGPSPALALSQVTAGTGFAAPTQPGRVPNSASNPTPGLSQALTGTLASQVVQSGIPARQPAQSPHDSMPPPPFRVPRPRPPSGAAAEPAELLTPHTPSAPGGSVVDTVDRANELSRLHAELEALRAANAHKDSLLATATRQRDDALDTVAIMEVERAQVAQESKQAADEKTNSLQAQVTQLQLELREAARTAQRKQSLADNRAKAFRQRISQLEARAASAESVVPSGSQPASAHSLGGRARSLGGARPLSPGQCPRHSLRLAASCGGEGKTVWEVALPWWGGVPLVPHLVARQRGLRWMPWRRWHAGARLGLARPSSPRTPHPPLAWHALGPSSQKALVRCEWTPRAPLHCPGKKTQRP